MKEDNGPFFFLMAMIVLVLTFVGYARGYKVATDDSIDNCIKVLEDFSHKEIKAYCEKLILNKDPK